MTEAKTRLEATVQSAITLRGWHTRLEQAGAEPAFREQFVRAVSTEAFMNSCVERLRTEAVTSDAAAAQMSDYFSRAEDARTKIIRLGGVSDSPEGEVVRAMINDAKTLDHDVLRNMMVSSILKSS